MTIVITKMNPNAARLIEDLAQYKIKAVHFKSININSNQPKFSLNDPRFSDLNAFIAFSPRAIEYIQENYTWPNIKYFAIGKSSAKIWQKKHNFKIHTPNIASSFYLQKILEDHKFKDKKIILLQADNGVDTIERYLIKNQAIVYKYSTYKREIADFLKSDIDYFKKIDLNIINFTSLEVTKKFYENANYYDRKWNKGLHYLVAGERIAKYLLKVKHDNFTVSKDASNKNLLKAILNLIKTKGRT